MTVAESLRASVRFGVPEDAIGLVCLRRGISPAEEFDPSSDRKGLDLATADLIADALTAPNRTEGEMSESYPNAKYMLAIANRIYARYGEPLIQDAVPPKGPTVKRIDL